MQPEELTKEGRRVLAVSIIEKLSKFNCGQSWIESNFGIARSSMNKWEKGELSPRLSTLRVLLEAEQEAIKKQANDFLGRLDESTMDILCNTLLVKMEERGLVAVA